MAGAALLSLPVAVAAVIGFSDGFGGVVRGFDALDGPEATVGEAADGDGLDLALVSLVGSDEPSPDGEPRQSPPDGSPPDGGPTPPPAPPGSDSGPAVQVPGGPSVPIPVNDPNGSVDSLVDNVNRTLEGLVGDR